MTLIIAEGKDPRPTKQAKPGTGRPDKLTPDASDRILAAVRNHQPLDVAAGLADVDRVTFYGWLRTAAEVRTFIDKGGKRSELTAYQKKCDAFSNAITKAQDQAHAIALKGVMDGGLKPQRTTRRTRKYVGKDENNAPLYAEEEQVTEAPPDTGNLKWYLERTHHRWAPKTQLEVTGANGGPVEIEFAIKLSAIEESIRNHQAAIAAESRESE